MSARVKGRFPAGCYVGHYLPAVYFFLRRFTRFERRNLAFGDLDLFPGLRVAFLARGTLAHFEVAESDQLHLVPCAKRFLDGFKNGFPPPGSRPFWSSPSSPPPGRPIPLVHQSFHLHMISTIALTHVYPFRCFPIRFSLQALRAKRSWDTLIVIQTAGRYQEGKGDLAKLLPAKKALNERFLECSKDNGDQPAGSFINDSAQCFLQFIAGIVRNHGISPEFLP